VADARGVSSIGCIGSGTLELSTTGGGGPPRTVEYSSDGVHLVRWASVNNKDYYVADGLSDISCQTLSGGAGVEVAMTFGEAPISSLGTDRGAVMTARGNPAAIATRETRRGDGPRHGVLLLAL
jgi:hypothetical protein